MFNHNYQSISPRNQLSYLDSLKLKYSRKYDCNRPLSSRPALHDHTYHHQNKEEQYRS